MDEDQSGIQETRDQSVRKESDSCPSNNSSSGNSVPLPPGTDLRYRIPFNAPVYLQQRMVLNQAGIQNQPDNGQMAWRRASESAVRAPLFKPYEAGHLDPNGEVDPDCNSAWGFPSLPTINTQFLKNSTSSISEFLPSVGLPSISQHMPRMSIPSMSMPSMPSMPSFTMPNLPSMPSMPSLPTFMSYRQHKSWNDLREAVRIAHRRLSEIANRVPFAFSFREIEAEMDDGTGGRRSGVRLYFLCPSATSPDTTLHYCDVFEEEESNSANETMQSDGQQSPSEKTHSSDFHQSNSKLRTFEWHPLLHPTFKKPNESDNELNLEEKLLMERKRCMLSGITSYEFEQKLRRFVFASGCNLFYFDDDQEVGQESQGPPYTPIRVETLTNAAKMNPQLCPHNPDLIAFTSDGNLYVANIKSGQEVRLTDVPDPLISAGVPSYVIQEEFRRYSGFWWQPPITTSNDAESQSIEYSILYEEIDETHVDVVRIPSYDGTSEEYRYPRAGEQNATSCLKLVRFKYETSSSCIFNLEPRFQSVSLPDLRAISPDFEYLVRAGWYDADVYWVQTLNRKQNHLDLLFFSLSNSFPPQVVLQEISADLWVKVGDLLHFLKESPSEPLGVGSSVKFIWTSEETGFRHLYSVHVELVSQDQDPNTSQDLMECATIGILQSKLIEKRAITAGNWEASDRDVWIDEKSQLIYFVGLKEIPLERHLYVTTLNPIDGSYPLKRLTDSGFSHSYIAFDPAKHFFVNVQSNISLPPFGFVHRLQTQEATDETPPTKPLDPVVPVAGSSSPKRRIMDNSTSNSSLLPDFKKLGIVVDNPFLAAIESQQLTTESLALIQSSHMDFLPGLPKPELFTYNLKGSGDVVYGVVFKPEFMENGMKYPCILDVYGGPEVQVVTNSFKGIRLVRRHLLASEGYVVCAFDCRGSDHRGKRFEGHIFKSMGQLEIADQVELLHWLAENTGYIDLKRVAVHGWSYGGYLSLMALAQRPDVFKLAIAGAPVTKWTLYDTGYTERYMDTPFNNPEGYEKGSVLSYVNCFPDEENRLLVIHGLMDENVHFIHSAELINALIKAGKPYQLQVYPSERHSLRNGPCCEHYETYLLSYLQQHL